MTLARPLRLVLAPSRVLAATILGVHALAAISIWMVAPGMAGGVIAGLLVALGAVAARDRGLLRARSSVRAIEIMGSDALLLELADGARLAVRAAPRRHVSRLGVALSVHAPQRRSLFIAADMLDPAAFRRLRLWALWGRIPGAEGELHAG